MDGERIVKVDNWATFFLSKLQALYIRGDYTDLTLQFHTNECIKVHRLVLKTCTEYFETLIKQNNVTNYMRLPPNFQSDVVVPIINFMYSGRLEFRPELHQRLYNTARTLNMQILTKLLETHVTAASTTVRNLKTLALPVSGVGSIPYSPAVNSRYISEGSDIVPGKKLPIWKKRSTPSSSFSLNVSTTKPVPEEPARPTRFEWPEDGDSDAAPIPYSSTFDDISYDSVPIVKSINSIVQSALPPTPSQPLVQLPLQRVMPAATFESVFQSSNLKRDAISRPQGSHMDCSLPKKARVDIDDVKELVQEQEARKALMTEDTDQENEDLDDFLPAADNDAEDFEDELEDTNESGKDFEASQYQPTTPPNKQNTPKPILKVQAHDSPEASKETTPKKNVRFHLEPKVHAVTTSSISQDSQTFISAGNSEDFISEATVNQTVEATSNEPSNSLDPIIPKKEVNDGAFEVRTPLKKSGDSSTSQQKSPSSTNHAKIIAEVLKKYPDLVKNNKNIRLKIIQKDGSPAVSVEKSGGSGDGKPKVSYMVVKADPSMKNKMLDEESKQSGVFNRTGPWLCSTCNPGKPINFETYFNYRTHLKEVHNEKVDVRICEHCGHRANKRNLLLYHLYKVHGIPPPPSCKFPKCETCNHIALSEVLLAKHRNIHIVIKDFSCNVCHATHKSHAALQAHLENNLVCNPQGKELMCNMCRTSFKTSTALQTHLENNERCNPRKREFKCHFCNKLFAVQSVLRNHIHYDHPHVNLAEEEQVEVKITEEVGIPQALPEDEIVQHQHAMQQLPEHPMQQQSLDQTQQQQSQQQSLDQSQQQQQTQQQSLDQTQQQQSQQHTQDQLNAQVLQTQTSIEVQTEVHPQATINAQPQTTYILPPGVTILTDNNQALMPSTEAEALSNVASGIAASLGVADSMVVSDQGQHQTFIVVDKNSLIQIPGPPGTQGQVHEYIVPDLMTSDMSQSVGVYTPGHLSQLVQYTTAGGLQQPVAVSTSDQGLMTITAVNANGSIVNHQGGGPIMETAMMQIPQGHIQDHNGGEITMILTDHAYSEGIVRENGTVMQTTSVPVSMSMVPTSAVVSVVSAVPTIPTSVPTSSMADTGMVITSGAVQSISTIVPASSLTENASVITSMEGTNDTSNSTSVGLGDEHCEQQVPDESTQKMAELASDWDDVEESDDHTGLQRSADDVAEDAALPSRPSILLKNELDGDDIPDNLPLKMT